MQSGAIIVQSLVIRWLLCTINAARFFHLISEAISRESLAISETGARREART